MNLYYKILKTSFPIIEAIIKQIGLIPVDIYPVIFSTILFTSLFSSRNNVLSRGDEACQ